MRRTAHPQKGKVSEVCHNDKEYDQMLWLVSSLHSPLHSISSYQPSYTRSSCNSYTAFSATKAEFITIFVCNIESHSSHRTKCQKVCALLSWKKLWADESISSLSSLHHNQSHCVKAENGSQLLVLIFSFSKLLFKMVGQQCVFTKLSFIYAIVISKTHRNIEVKWIQYLC